MNWVATREEDLEKTGQIKKRLVILFASLMVIVTTICIVVQYRHYQIPELIEQDDYQAVQSTNYEYSLDQIRKRNATYDYVSGWVAVPRIKILQYHTRLVLYRPHDSKMLAFDAHIVNRPDVGKHLGDGRTHRASGFEIVIPAKYMKQGDYRIGFLVDVGKEPRLFKTGVSYQLMHGRKDQ
jgi:hypothetical protein